MSKKIVISVCWTLLTKASATRVSGDYCQHRRDIHPTGNCSECSCGGFTSQLERDEIEALERRGETEMRFIVYADRGGWYRWHVVAENGQITATSGESFYNESNAVRAARRFEKSVGTEAPLEIIRQDGSILPDDPD